MTKKAKLYYAGSIVTIMGTIAFVLEMVHHFQNLATTSVNFLPAIIVCLGATLMNLNNIEKDQKG